MKDLGKLVKPFSFRDIISDFPYNDHSLFAEDQEPEINEKDIELYEKFQNVDKAVNRERVKKFDNSVFYQKETFTLTNEVDTYDFRFNANFRYCIGFIILNHTAIGRQCFIGVKKDGIFELDKVPCALAVSDTTEFTKKIFPVKLHAGGKQHSVYFDKNGVTVSSLEILFVLSNNSVALKKRSFGYTYVSTPNGSTSNGTLDIDFNKKRIKGIAFFYVGGSGLTATISILDDSIKYIDSLSGSELDSNSLDDIEFKHKFININIPAKYIDYEIVNASGATANIFIIYEYE